MRHMIDAGIEGAIVNNASVIGWRAQAEQCHYAAAKAGVMALTRCAALEAAEHWHQHQLPWPPASRCTPSSRR